MTYPIGFLGMPGGAEWIVIAVIGLLLFGKRLPEVGRSLGKGIVEFKKGLKGVEEEVDQAAAEGEAKQVATQAQQQPMLTNQAVAGQPAPKFDPYTGKPIENSAASQT